MKWCICDVYKGSLDVYPYNSKEEALAEAEKRWSSLEDYEKLDRGSFTVELLNVGEDGEYIEDENGNADTKTYELAKEFR